MSRGFLSSGKTALMQINVRSYIRETDSEIEIMLSIPVLRWGRACESSDSQEYTHFHTGEPLAKVSQASPGWIAEDLRQAARAREILRDISCRELIERLRNAAELFKQGTLPIGTSEQSPDDFVRQQSGTTGLPENLCRANMEKNHTVLRNLDRILDVLTRGLDLEILTRGYGLESRGVTVSYQAQSPVLAMVLPSNSPGVHTLWLPAIALQIGLALKPGGQEFWTPYRLAAAFSAAGIPREVVGIYPGRVELVSEITARCGRTLIFGNTTTIKDYEGHSRVRVHGPGFSKILLGDDAVDEWEQYLEVMVESVLANAGRGCINCSGIWVSRHAQEISEALAERLGPIDVKTPDDPAAALAAFTTPGRAQAVHDSIVARLNEDGVANATAKFGPRLVEMKHHGYLRPWIICCDAPERALANTEFMFPFVAVVQCPQGQMVEKIGHTLVCTAITSDEAFRRQLIEAACIDRLNLGSIPTVKIDWQQPHEGNLVNFLFRSRALQFACANPTGS